MWGLLLRGIRVGPLLSPVCVLFPQRKAERTQREARPKNSGVMLKLTTLFQKRMVELNRPGARTLVKVEGDKNQKKDFRRIVIEEILQEKIQLAPREEVGYSLEEEKILLEKESETASAPTGDEDEAPAGSEIYGSDLKKIKEQRIKELAQLLNPKK